MTGSLELRHSTVANNAGVGVDNAAGGTVVSIAHSILYGNGGDDLLNDPTPCAGVTWSDIGTVDCTSAGNNLQADPLLTTDYHLGSGSPCLEHGPDPLSYTGVPCFDLDGGPRLRDHDGDGWPHMDVGAYEEANPALLAEPGGLRWLDEDTLDWDPVTGADEYHVYRDERSNVGYDRTPSCHDTVTSTTLVDTGRPSPGQAWMYRVTAEDLDPPADESSLGLGTCAERANPAPCP
jgi:hypothetical protein